MREEFIAGLRARQKEFGLELADAIIDRLADYYELVQQHNPILHLVGPCSHEEFATRHILESLTLLEHLPTGSRFADVGAGAGLPSIPCLIARDDLQAVLIESKEKKAGFLQATIEACGLGDRGEVIDRQFSETKSPDAGYVTCRALDRFIENLPRLLKWSGKRKLRFFGGPAVREALLDHGIKFDERLMPLSSQRYLFVSK
jgi:16S rRNA (guanine(527)-N(7))-methyltransferase RsmG